MRCLVVLAHPLPSSLTRHFCDAALKSLHDLGHKTQLLDLYMEGFDPRLKESERATYYGDNYDRAWNKANASRLSEAELVVLVFPTWWFGLPATLKGWIDRTFTPDVAFAHGADFGPIKPLLTKLKHVVVVTTLGSPWWVDWLVMRRPVRRTLKMAVFRACAPQAKFHMFSFYNAERPAPERVGEKVRKLGELLTRLR